MSDQLIAAAEARVERGALRQAAVIVAIFAIAGVLCGLLWEALWTPAQGGVIKHVWYPVSWYAWQDTFFAASAWYVVVGAVAGLLLGALAAWRFDRAEMVSLAAVVVGGLVAALLMRLVGMHRGPGDPQAAAKTAADGVTLPSEFTAPSWWLLLVFPGSALASLGLYFMTVAKRGASGPENTTAQPPPAE